MRKNGFWVLLVGLILAACLFATPGFTVSPVAPATTVRGCKIVEVKPRRTAPDYDGPPPGSGPLLDMQAQTAYDDPQRLGGVLLPHDRITASGCSSDALVIIDDAQGTGRPPDYSALGRLFHAKLVDTLDVCRTQCAEPYRCAG